MKLIEISPSVVEGEVVGMYFIYSVDVQRGMGNQKANEVLIYGVPIKSVKKYIWEHQDEIKGYYKNVQSTKIRKD